MTRAAPIPPALLYALNEYTQLIVASKWNHRVSQSILATGLINQNCKKHSWTKANRGIIENKMANGSQYKMSNVTQRMKRYPKVSSFAANSLLSMQGRKLTKRQKR